MNVWYSLNQFGVAFLLGLGAYNWMIWCLKIAGVMNDTVPIIGMISGIMGAWAGIAIFNKAYGEELQYELEIPKNQWGK